MSRGDFVASVVVGEESRQGMAFRVFLWDCFDFEFQVGERGRQILGSKTRIFSGYADCNDQNK